MRSLNSVPVCEWEQSSPLDPLFHESYHFLIGAVFTSLGVMQAFIGADRSERGVRLDAIHVRGVDNMCTADVFHYFQDFEPEVVEWIDDMSCKSEKSNSQIL